MSDTCGEGAKRRLEAGHAAWSEGRPDIAHDLYAEAEALARASGEAWVLSHALTARGLCLYERCEEDKALELHEEARGLASADDGYFAALISRRIAACLMDLGRFEEADAALGPEPAEDAPPEIVLGWRHYRMQLAEQSADLEAVLQHAADIRDDWELHGHKPEIQVMANALVVATTARAVLGADAERASVRAEMASFDETGLSLNLRSNFALLRAEMAFDEGDTEGALAILQDAAATFVASYGNLPSDILSATMDMLRSAGRENEVFDRIDLLWEGGLSDGSARLVDAPSAAADLLGRLLDLSDLAERAPSVWQDVRSRAMELSEHPGTKMDMVWQLKEVLARRLEPPRSRLLLAKQACSAVARLRASDLIFPEARRRYAEARTKPFETALGILYGMGRLAEARSVQDLAQDLCRAPGLSTRLAPAEQGLLTSDECAVANLPMDRNKIDGLIEGTIWAALPAKPVSVEPTYAESTVLRYVRTDSGWIVDATGRSGARRCSIEASTGTLAKAVHAILSAGEAGHRDPEAASLLRRILLDPVSDLLCRGRPIAVSAAGCLSTLPFSLLRPEEELEWVYLRGGSATATRVPSSFGRAALLHDGQVDVRAEEAVLEDTFLLSKHAVNRDGLVDALAARADVLHVAGHFETRGWDSLMTGLRCADQGLLSIRAIKVALGQAAAPPVVCLGLCETAGIFSAGQSEVDLPSLFLHAGSAVVIATAWRISDTEAGCFARRFYTELAQSGDPAGAFSVSRPNESAFMLFVGRGSV
ncbi:tetratricopeptide (TPR) repeat protein [Roseovarius sp. MBR-79]